MLIVGSTYRFEIIGKIPTEKVLYVIWHRNMLPLIYYHRFSDIAVLVSASRDGSLVANPMEVLGYKPVRGSSSRKSNSALKQLIKETKIRSLAITPDGPKGPLYELKEGVLFLSYLTKKGIIPVKMTASSEWTFRTWDDFRLPKPFAKITLEYHSPIYVQRKDEFQTKKKVIEDLMGE